MTASLNVTVKSTFCPVRYVPFAGATTERIAGAVVSTRMPVVAGRCPVSETFARCG